MKYQEPSPEEYLKIAQRVRSGEYFREAQAMYDFSVNNTMSERYFYLFLTVLALLTTFSSFIAVQGMYPLSHAKPFAFSTTDMVEEVPRIRPLREYAKQPPSEAVLNFLLRNFITLYEEYNANIVTSDRNKVGIQSQSEENVYKVYELLLNPANPESPVAVYQRHSTRSIAIKSIHHVEGDPKQRRVVFEATVEGRGIETKKTMHEANISFRYSGVELDDSGVKVKPLTFIVTDYRSHRI